MNGSEVQENSKWSFWRTFGRGEESEEGSEWSEAKLRPTVCGLSLRGDRKLRENVDVHQSWMDNLDSQDELPKDAARRTVRAQVSALPRAHMPRTPG